VADDSLRSLGRRSTLGFAGAGVSGLATIAGLVIAGRALGPQGAGVFFVAISVFSIVQGICSLGVDTGLQYWVPTRPGSARRLIGSTNALVGLCALVASVAVWVASVDVAGALAGPAQQDLVRGVLRSTAVFLPFGALYETLFGGLRSLDRMVPAVVLDRVLRPVMQVVLMLVVAVRAGGPEAMAIAWMTPFALCAVGAATLLVRCDDATGGDVHIAEANDPPVPARAFWRYTAPRGVARVAQVLTQRLDVLVIASVVGVAEAGVYGTVSRCMIAGVFVATALQQVVQPRLRSLVVALRLDAVKRTYGATTTWLVLVTWPPYLCLAIFAPVVLSGFGSEFESGGTALAILCITMLVASGCGLVDVVLLMLGRSWLSTANVLAALAVNIVANLVLVPRLGMEGAAIAWSLAILTTNLVPLAQTAHRGLHPGGRPLVTAMSCALAGVALPLATARLLLGATTASFVLGLILSAIVYGTLVAHERRALLLDTFVDDLRARPAASPPPPTASPILTSTR
jgi:O-antigen/teichoic acid export membrane protein